MSDDPENAGEEARRAKSRLIARAEEVRARMTPAALVADAKTKAQDMATKSRDTAKNAIRSNPRASVGAVAAIALFLFRKPVFGAMRRLIKKESKDG
jgi:ElaB/YqjD/DUF883 family membrane-anchored ribosome-binding protein